MDILQTMRTVNSVGKYLMIFVFALSMLSMVAATSAPSNIKSGMKLLCETAQAVLAGAAMVLVVLAAIVYAIGQVVGAETRARASVWATAMITGAIIGIIIYLVVPYIIVALLGSSTGSSISLTSGNPCSSI